MPPLNAPEAKSAVAVAVLPEQADQARIQFVHGRSNAPPPRAMFVVKIYLYEPMPAAGQVAALYVGDEWIRKFFEFPGGVYFNVYDADFFQRHAGNLIRFTFDHESFFDAGVRLPAPDATTNAALTDQNAPLPTKQDSLKS